EKFWEDSLSCLQQLALEHLAIHREGGEPRTINVQPASRYHGQVPAFMSEIRSKLASGENVLITAATAGELERLADLCREYEVAYQLGEMEKSATGVRLVEDVSVLSGHAAILFRAPISEGFLIPDVHLVFHGNADVFDTLPRAEKQRARVKTGS